MAVSGPLDADVPLARFSASGDIRAEKRPRVKDRFMLPRREPTSGRWALSTSRVDGMSADEKRAFGEDWVRTHLGAGRSLKAHCEVPVGAVESAASGELHADFDDRPPRHVNVLGWPEEEDGRLAIAQELCARIETEGHVERYA